MDKIARIDDHFIEANTNFKDLVNALKIGFSYLETIVPMRHHHDFPNPAVGSESTLLLMPAWNPSKEAGVKVVTVSPENGKFNLPTIQGTYIYLDAEKGSLKAVLEAKTLTAKRTAAASALASSFLSKEESTSLLMIGTGALSVNLIKAHTSVRPIDQVYIWGRNIDKAQAVCEELSNQGFSIKAIQNIDDKISEVDIISCATLSKIPLVLGKFLKPGQHIDLVGAYRKDMREADNETVQKSSIYLDTLQAGVKESGDIVIPLQEGTITEKDIKADLFELCSGKKQGRSSDDEITMFKSVGHALEDLVAARHYYNQYMNE